MEKGYISVESVRPLAPAEIVWTYETGDSYVLTSAVSFAWNKSLRLPAFQCEGCGIVEFEIRSDSPSDEETHEKT